MARLLLGLIPLLVFFVLALVVGSQNTDVVSVNLIVFQTEATLATVIAWSLAIGFFFGLSSFIASYLGLRFRYRRLRKDLIQRAKAGK
ncbi:MAG: LapA family protein [Idiomarina sp.]|nr:LapA family protein [Idiomarina sp.]